MALLEFYGKECPHCIRLQPVIDVLKEEGYKITQYEVWHNEKNAAKLEEYDRGFCGGVPFFVNTVSKRFLCGGGDAKTLRAWADGKAGEPMK